MIARGTTPALAVVRVAVTAVLTVIAAQMAITIFGYSPDRDFFLALGVVGGVAAPLVERLLATVNIRPPDARA